MSKTIKSKKVVYSPHPSIRLVQSWIEQMVEKTGRSLDQWMAFIKKEGPSTEEARREWLKSEHELGTNTAWWLAERSVGKNTEEENPQAYLRDCPKWVDDMYSGKREGLRPVHDALIALGQSIGKDVKVCPCKTIVPFYRQHVFAQVKPASNTRIDFGLSLGDPAKVKTSKRVVDTGGFAKKDRITHKIPIATLDEVDDEVEKWLRAAYERDAQAPRRDAAGQ
jgi:hypothetical protein